MIGYRKWHPALLEWGVALERKCSTMNTDTFNMLQQAGIRFSAWFEQRMFIITPISMGIGFVLHRYIADWGHVIPLLFAYLTFVLALGCSPGQVAKALKRPVIFILVLVLSHGIAPLIAYAAGAFIFGADSPYVIGMVLFAVIPLGVSSVIWVGMAGGLVSFILPLVVIDSILSPF